MRCQATVGEFIVELLAGSWVLLYSYIHFEIISKKSAREVRVHRCQMYILQGAVFHVSGIWPHFLPYLWQKSGFALMR